MNNNYEEGSRWLRQAEIDLESARWNFKGKFFADACFKCQQAVEKALKGFCYMQGERSIPIHSTRELCMKSSKYDNHFEDFVKKCSRLDKFYITARYPDGLPSGIPHEYFEEDEAEEAIGYAGEIIDYIKSKFEGADNIWN